jgi:hypothetical protein
MEEIMKNLEKIESVQAILEEAGLYHRRGTQVIADENGIITLEDSPLADRNYNDIVDFEDVLVRDGGEKLEVVDVDVENGIIKLAKPLNGDDHLWVNYAYSSVSASFVEKVRGEVLAEVRRVLSEAEIERNLDSVRWIVRLYSAGKLLIRDYGFNQDLENTSKDGYKKIDLAKSQLNELIAVADNYQKFGEMTCENDGDLFTKTQRNCWRESDF